MSPARAVLAAAVLAAALPAPGAAQAPGEPRDDLPRPSPQAETAFLAFRHAGLVDTVVTALYDRDSLYVPFGEVFRTLGVPVVLDLARGRATGFFLDRDRDYELSPADGTARLSGHETVLANADALVGDLDLYVLPGVLERVFGIRVSVDLSELALRIDPLDRVFPVVATERRRLLRDAAGADRLAPHAPLTAARLRRPLYGGVLDYSLDASAGAGPDVGSFGLATGFEVAGGDLEAGIRGTAAAAGVRASEVRGSWRYVFADEERRVSQVRIGSVTPAGLRAFELHGVRVTNEPVQRRRVFAVHTVRGRTEPDAEVELYVNGRLQDFTTADGTGAYDFRVPLYYGRSILSLRFYGASGEFLREERGIPVPFGLVPAGAVDYALAGGARADEDGAALLSRVAWGINGSVTNAVGLEYVDAAATGSELVFFDSFIARLTDGLHGALDVAPGAYTRLAMEGFSSSLASAALELTRFSESPTYNPLGEDWRLRLTGFTPYRLWGLGMTGRVLADWTRSEDGQGAAALELEAVASVGRLRQSVGYRTRTRGGFLGPAESRELLLGTLYNLSVHDGALAPLNGTLVRALYAHGLHDASGNRSADRSRGTPASPSRPSATSRSTPGGWRSGSPTTASRCSPRSASSGPQAARGCARPCAGRWRWIRPTLGSSRPSSRGSAGRGRPSGSSSTATATGRTRRESSSWTAARSASASRWRSTAGRTASSARSTCWRISATRSGSTTPRCATRRSCRSCASSHSSPTRTATRPSTSPSTWAARRKAR